MGQCLDCLKGKEPTDPLLDREARARAAEAAAARAAAHENDPLARRQKAAAAKEKAAAAPVTQAQHAQRIADIMN